MKIMSGLERTLLEVSEADLGWYEDRGLFLLTLLKYKGKPVALRVELQTKQMMLFGDMVIEEGKLNLKNANPQFCRDAVLGDEKYKTIEQVEYRYPVEEIKNQTVKQKLFRWFSMHYLCN